MTSKRLKIQRRSPAQARSRATVDAILEAASQILERDGAAGFNTNAVAERAGVSIGTLYQYFPDKTAILLATAEREAACAEARPARYRALLRALAGSLDSFRLGTAAARSGPSVLKPRRPSKQVVLRLQWGPLEAGSPFERVPVKVRRRR